MADIFTLRAQQQKALERNLADQEKFLLNGGLNKAIDISMRMMAPENLRQDSKFENMSAEDIRQRLDKDDPLVNYPQQLRERVHAQVQSREYSNLSPYQLFNATQRQMWEHELYSSDKYKLKRGDKAASIPGFSQRKQVYEQEKESIGRAERKMALIGEFADPRVTHTVHQLYGQIVGQQGLPKQGTGDAMEMIADRVLEMHGLTADSIVQFKEYRRQEVERKRQKYLPSATDIAFGMPAGSKQAIDWAKNKAGLFMEKPEGYDYWLKMKRQREDERKAEWTDPRTAGGALLYGATGMLGGGIEAGAQMWRNKQLAKAGTAVAKGKGVWGKALVGAGLAIAATPVGEAAVNVWRQNEYARAYDGTLKGAAMEMAVMGAGDIGSQQLILKWMNKRAAKEGLKGGIKSSAKTKLGEAPALDVSIKAKDYEDALVGMNFPEQSARESALLIDSLSKDTQGKVHMYRIQQLLEGAKTPDEGARFIKQYAEMNLGATAKQITDAASKATDDWVTFEDLMGGLDIFGERPTWASGLEQIFDPYVAWQIKRQMPTEVVKAAVKDANLFHKVAQSMPGDFRLDEMFASLSVVPIRYPESVAKPFINGLSEADAMRQGILLDYAFKEVPEGLKGVTIRSLADSLKGSDTKFAKKLNMADAFMKGDLTPEDVARFARQHKHFSSRAPYKTAIATLRAESPEAADLFRAAVSKGTMNLEDSLADDLLATYKATFHGLANTLPVEEAASHAMAAAVKEAEKMGPNAPGLFREIMKEPIVAEALLSAEENIAKDVLANVLMGTVGMGVVGVTVFGSPDNAEALSPKPLIAVLKQAGVHADDITPEVLMKEMIVRRWIHDPVELQQKLPGVIAPPLRSCSVRPTKDQYVELVKRTKEAAQSRMGTLLTKFGSLNTGATILYGSKAANPAVDLAHGALTAAQNSVDISYVVSKEILHNVEDASSIAIEATRDLVQEYAESAMRYKIHAASAKIGKQQVAKMRKATEKLSQKGKLKELQKETLRQLEDTYIIHDTKAKALQPAYDEYKAKTMERFAGVAKDNADIRIALATEDVIGEYSVYPFLKGMITTEDEAAATMLQGVLKTVSKEIVDAGQRPITYMDYIQHAKHPDNPADLFERAMNMEGYDPSGKEFLSKLHSRSLDSFQEVPSATYIMNKYIPDITRRIEAARFWQAWAPHKNSDFVQNNRLLRDFWISLNDGFAPSERYSFDRVMNTAYAFDVAQKLFLSPAPAFKHVLKQTASVAILGPSRSAFNPKILRPAAKNSWNYAKTTLRNDMDALIKLGDTPQARAANKLWGASSYSSESIEENLFKTFVSTQRMWKIINDVDMPKMGDTTVHRFLESADDAMNSTAERATFLINLSEVFDRGVVIHGSLRRAAEKGLSPKQAINGLLENILTVNFLSGQFTPRWVRQPSLRFLFMFQSTPFKILENRLLRMHLGTKDVIRNLDQMVGEALSFRKGYQEAARETKFKLIKDALTSEKDAFGTAYSNIFMRELLTIGAAGVTGNAIGVNLWDHLVHLPFFSFSGHTAEMHLSPMVAALSEEYHKATTGEKYFSMGEFFQRWMGTKSGLPIPLILAKMLRLSQNDIPEIYRKSDIIPPWAAYILGTPAQEVDAWGSWLRRQ